MQWSHHDPKQAFMTQDTPSHHLVLMFFLLSEMFLEPRRGSTDGTQHSQHLEHARTSLCVNHYLLQQEASWTRVKGSASPWVEAQIFIGGILSMITCFSQGINHLINNVCFSPTC